MGPPPPPRAQPPKAAADSSFLEKLHAVEEELAVCMKPFQVRLPPQPPPGRRRRRPDPSQTICPLVSSSLCLSLTTTWG